MRASDEFRQNARDCIRLAETADTSQSRSLLLQLAETWTRFAVQADMVAADEPDAAGRDEALPASRARSRAA
jgi:hypothetical protein